MIRSGPNCAYLVLPREMHVDVLSSKFPLTELFTLNYADQLRGSHLSLCCLYGDQPNPEQVAGLSGLNADCSGSSEERTLHQRSIVVQRNSGKLYPVVDVSAFLIFSLSLPLVS
jgi:hypothetical protein